MIKSYLAHLILSCILVTFTLADGDSRITAENPAAIRQVILDGNTAVLKLQVINRGFPKFRCICPETTFSNRVKENNGNFEVRVRRKWLAQKNPELVKNPHSLVDLFMKKQEILKKQKESVKKL